MRSKAYQQNENVMIQRIPQTGMSSKQFRRYWIKQKKRSIKIISAVWASFFVVSHTEVGCVADYYLTEGWRRLLAFFVPDYYAPESARETMRRVRGLDPETERQLTEWFLRYDRATPTGVTGAMFGGPESLTLNDFMSYAASHSNPPGFLQQLLQEFPYDEVEARERQIEAALESVKQVEEAFAKAEEIKATKAVALTNIATTTREITRLKSKLRKFADPRLQHILSLYEADLKELKMI